MVPLQRPDAVCARAARLCAIAVALIAAGTLLIGAARASTRTTPSWAIDRLDQADLPLDGRIGTTASGRGVLVYVVDSGVAAGHPELAGRVLPGWSHRVGVAADRDCIGHGTAVASLVAGSRTGVAPGARIVPVRFMTCGADTTAADLLAALGWIRDTHPAGTPGVVNLSLGTTPGDDDGALRAITAELAARGLAIVGAAGNDRGDACASWPGSDPNVIVASATTRADALWPDANRGPCVDLLAPGEEAMTATPGDGYAPLSGTSVSAPLVAGALALAWEAQPGAPATDVIAQVISQATPDRVRRLPADTPNRLLAVRDGAFPTDGRAAPSVIASPTRAWVDFYFGMAGVDRYTVTFLDAAATVVSRAPFTRVLWPRRGPGERVLVRAYRNGRVVHTTRMRISRDAGVRVARALP